MILAAVRDLVRERRQATLAEIAHHFDAAPDALRGMLQFWIDRGRLHRRHAALACGGCRRCDPAATEFYVWGAAAEEAVLAAPPDCYRGAM